MKQILIGLILAIFILTLVSADVLTPGFHPIDVENTITNIDDFPDYVFVAYNKGPMGVPVKLISEDGKIGSYYKFCNVDVYAIKKTDWDPSILSIDEVGDENYQSIEEYLDSVDKKKVIEHLIVYEEVNDVSTKKSINYVYTIDLEKTKTAPDKTNVEKNKLVYIYVLIPIIALIIILVILYKRKR